MSISFEASELLDDGKEGLFGDGSAFEDPLVENGDDGDLGISQGRNPTVEMVHWRGG